MRRLLPMLMCIPLLAAGAATAAQVAPATLSVEALRADARSIEPLINQNYAYLDRFEGETMPASAKLRAEAEQVTDRRSLLRVAERMLMLLADHHAITGSSTSESWAVVPTYSDLWIEKRGNQYVVEAVRDGSPAERSGVRAGDRLLRVRGVPTQQAVDAFWSDLGVPSKDERAGFAARVLAAGRRNAPRRLSFGSGDVPPRELELPNLYSLVMPDRPVLEARPVGRELVIKLNDSLGDDRTIPAFDSAMQRAKPGQRVVIDLTDTPSGGNTTVARAILGWFVTKPTPYQIHNLPAEERRTGVPRQWVEQVLPRKGKHHAGPVLVRVGRWTGSMGEGLAIGFHAIGGRVEGTRMASLLGAIYDHRLENSGLVLKLPTERLYATDGTPRESFTPRQ